MFEAVFGKFGLSSEIIFPSYGLAEHTFLVSRCSRSLIELTPPPHLSAAMAAPSSGSTGRSSKKTSLAPPPPLPPPS
jgi:hypothetical protein